MIDLKVIDRIATITLNRPEKMNALHPELMRELINAFSSFAADDMVSVIVLTGQGNAFCAGADLAYMLELKNAGRDANAKDVDLLSEFFTTLRYFPKMLICAVNGAAMAGGCGVALTGDVIFADSVHAKFGFPEIKRGFIPALVSDILLDRVPFSIAKRLLLSGETLDAQQSKSLGLVDFISNNVVEDAINYAKKVLRNPAATTVTIKKMLFELREKEGYDRLTFLKEVNLDGRFTPEFDSGISSFLHKKE